jgi:hypothetical protein
MTVYVVQTVDSEDKMERAQNNRDYVWGATKAAVVVFQVREDDPDFKTFRRKLFRTYEHWKARYYESVNRGRPLPPNVGFVIIDGCAQIILSRSAHQAYINSQLGGRS